MKSHSALLDLTAAAPFAGQRILVTGASGFLGWQVVRQGLAAGVEVHTLGRSAGPEGAAFHAADLTAAGEIAAIVEQCKPTAVIHCAAPGVARGSLGFAEMLAVTAGGTAALLAACAIQSKRPRVVLVGSGFEYAPASRPVDEDWPLEPAPQSYGAAKVAATRVATEFAGQLPIALLRPFHIYGAGEAERRLGPFIIAEARRGARIALTGCEQQRDFLHVDDCAAMLWDGLARLGDEPGLAIRNLGSGQPIALREFVESTVAELSHRGIQADCALGVLPYRDGEPMVSLPDLARWTADGGRMARISLIDGIADLVGMELARCP